MEDRLKDILLAGVEATNVYAVITVDNLGMITGWNAGAERLAGIPAMAMGSRLREVLTDDPGKLSVTHLGTLADRGGEDGLWIRGADGSVFWGKAAAARVLGDGETVDGYVVFIRDATALRAAREELERSRTMFEGILAIASDAVVCIDESQRIIFFNEGAERIFGYTQQEALGQLIEILIPERFRPEHAERIREFGRARVVAREMGDRGEISGRRQSGEVFPAEASISKLDVAGVRIYTAVLRDVTDRRRAQEALAGQAEDLARSNAELEQFAYVASHDLQEPLRMVASYTQLLARRYSGKLDEDADEFINFAVEGVSRMQALINDLLAYSRVGTRGVDMIAVSMEEAVLRALTAVGHSLAEAGATVTHDPLPRVYGDAGQLSQLVQNLVQNAIKFQRPDARPAVHIGVEDGGHVWRFSVRDNGIGIDPEFQDRIFVIFQRLHSRGEYPGTGIGLAICKKIVERHHGRIWVESEVGQGSTFHFTLPKGEQTE